MHLEVNFTQCAQWCAVKVSASRALGLDMGTVNLGKHASDICDGVKYPNVGALGAQSYSGYSV